MNEIIATSNAAAIKSNFERVIENVHLACNRSGRSHENVRVVVVTKGQPIDVIRQAIQAGIQRFGENYPEETAPKISAINSPGIEWHMIGHLQSRKSKIVAEYFHWFHALDSLRLAEKLNRTLAERNRKMPVLLECNVGGEDSKSGWLAMDENDWPRIADEAAAVLQYPCLEIRGLMTMPPFETDANQARKYFARLRDLRDYIQARNPMIDLAELSMGTSQDYETAVEEGATIIRVGQAILGPRPAR